MIKKLILYLSTQKTFKPHVLTHTISGNRFKRRWNKVLLYQILVFTIHGKT